MTRPTVLFMLLIAMTKSARKRWVGGSEWRDEDSWTPSLPKSCDTALLESNQILNLAGQAGIAELSFSKDSAIMFDSFSELSFGSAGGPCNSAGNTVFYQAQRDNFLDVNNWEFYSELADIGVLDTQRIPCTNDIIELPYREMRAELHSPVEVGAISYGGRFLTKTQVVNWLTSEEGRRELMMLSPLQISDATYCKVRGGCECGNKAICNTSNCRVPVQCNDPISSRTMCCAFCGSLITAPVNHLLSYRQLELELSAIVSEQSTPQLLKMGIQEGRLHLVLEEHGKLSTTSVAKSILDHLIQINYTTVSELELHQSSQDLAPIQEPARSGPTTNHLLLVLTLVCLLVCLAGALASLFLYCVRKKRVRKEEEQAPACNTYESCPPRDLGSWRRLDSDSSWRGGDAGASTWDQQPRGSWDRQQRGSWGGTTLLPDYDCAVFEETEHLYECIRASDNKDGEKSCCSPTSKIHLTAV